MHSLLTPEQSSRYAGFKEFARQMEPQADEWNKTQRLPDTAIRSLGDAGFLGACIPREYGGQGWDVTTFGLLNEALGRADSALTGVLTVQSMTSMALSKW